jgi:hypothetical protein
MNKFSVWPVLNCVSELLRYTFQNRICNEWEAKDVKREEIFKLINERKT